MEPLFDTNEVDEALRQQEQEFAKNQQLQQQQYDEDIGFFDRFTDAAFAPIRGVAAAAEGIYSLVDAIALDVLPDAPENFGLGSSQTMLGSAVEGIVQFGVGFVPGLGVASKVGKLTKLTDAGSKAVRSLQTVGRNKSALALARGMEAGKFAAAGAVADFTVFDGHEERLSNLIQAVPELQNPINEYLAADEDDSELEGRFKAALEGAGLGVALDAVLLGFRAMRAGVKKLPNRKAADAATREFLEEQNAERAAAKETEDVVEETVETEVKQAAVIDDDLKQMTKSQLREEAKKHPGVKRNGKGVTVDSLRQGIAEGRAAARGQAGEATEQVTEAVAKQADEAAEAAPAQTAKEAQDDLLNFENGGGTADMVENYLTKSVDDALKQSERAVQESSLTQETGESFDIAVEAQLRADEATALENAKLVDEATGTRLTDLEVRIRDAGEVTEETRKGLIRNRYRMGAIRQLLDETTSRLRKQIKEVRRTDISIDDRRKELAKFVLMQKNWKTLSNNIRATQSEFGRNLQSIQRPTGGTRASEVAQDIAEASPLDKFSEANLDQKDVVERILDIYGGEEAVLKEIDRTRAVLTNGRGAFLKYNRGKAGFMGVVNEWWMNSILSGPTTQLVNLAGGLATTLFAPLERAAGQALAGNYQNASLEVGRLLAMPSEIGDALKMAKQAYSTGQGVLETGATRTAELGLGEGRIESYLNEKAVSLVAAKWLARNVVNAPGKALAFTDEMFKQLNYRSMVKTDLYKQALNDKISPDLINDYVEKEFRYIVDDGQFLSSEKFVKEAEGMFDKADPDYAIKINDYVSKKMRRYSPIANRALDVARQVTFTTPLSKDRGILSGVGRGVQDITNKVPGAKLLLPFVRTPTNIIQYVLDRVPVVGRGQASAIQERLAQMFQADRAALTGLQKEQQSEALGRLATGITMFSGATIAAMNGGITGGGPKDFNQRRLKEQTGWQAYSINLGGSYLSYQRLDPFASFLGVAADLVDIMNQGDEEQRKDAMDLALGASMAIAKNITSKTYLKGVQDATNLLFNPEIYLPGVAQRTMASLLVPNLFAQIARSGPDEMMDIKRMKDALMARVPGLSDSVPHRRNMLGEEIMDNGTYAAVDLFNPFSYSTVKDDKMMQEFDQIGHGFSAPRSLKNGVELRDYFSDRNQSAYDRWLELSSGVRINGRNLRQELRKLMSSRQYKRLPYESVDGLDKSPRARLIQRVLNKYRSKAYAEMLDEFPEVNKRAKIIDMIKSRRRVGQDYQDLLRLIED